MCLAPVMGQRSGSSNHCDVKVAPRAAGARNHRDRSRSKPCIMIPSLTFMTSKLRFNEELMADVEWDEAGSILTDVDVDEAGGVSTPCLHLRRG